MSHPAPTLPLPRGEVTLETALEEDGVLLNLSYPEKRLMFFWWLTKRCKGTEDIVSYHLGLTQSQTCRVADVRDWVHGSVNVCLPAIIGSKGKLTSRHCASVLRALWARMVANREARQVRACAWASALARVLWFTNSLIVLGAA